VLYRTTLASAAAASLACGTAHATPVKQSAGPTQQTLEISDTALQSTTSLCYGWVTIPGAYIKITIPSGRHQLVTARFTAQATASNSATTYASGIFQIVTGNRILLPNGAGHPYIVTYPSTAFNALALERSIVLAPGTHTVKAQYCAADQLTTVSVADWHLTVEAAPLQ
jgi:hypothetical protein